MTDRSRPKKNTLGADLQKRGRALFTGRERETQELLTTLQALQLGESDDIEVNRIFNIYGQGGAGKSTLLREFEAICREQNVLYGTVDANRTSIDHIIDPLDLVHGNR